MGVSPTETITVVSTFDAYDGSLVEDAFLHLPMFTNSIVQDTDDVYIVGNIGTVQLERIDDSGAVMGAFGHPIAAFGMVKVDRQLFVCDQSTFTVKVYDLDESDAPPSSMVDAFVCSGLAARDDGQVYVALRRSDSFSGIVTVNSAMTMTNEEENDHDDAAANALDPFDLTLDPQGNLLITSLNGHLAILDASVNKLDIFDFPGEHLGIESLQNGNFLLSTTGEGTNIRDGSDFGKLQQVASRSILQFNALLLQVPLEMSWM